MMLLTVLLLLHYLKTVDFILLPTIIWMKCLGEEIKAVTSKIFVTQIPSLNSLFPIPMAVTFTTMVKEDQELIHLIEIATILLHFLINIVMIQTMLVVLILLLENFGVIIVDASKEEYLVKAIIIITTGI